MIITIDGTSGSGKSTVSKKFALKQKLELLNTGSLYRKITYDCITSNIDISEKEKVIEIALKCNFSSKYDMNLNDEKISKSVPYIAQIPEVRKRVKDFQLNFGSTENIVVEGRDIGTVVFPEAELKFYITASPETRAKRRYNELYNNGKEEEYNSVLSNIINRDNEDISRTISPLKVPEGAIEIDTSEMTIDEVIECMENEYRKLEK